jgi:hypothetical protein
MTYTWVVTVMLERCETLTGMDPEREARLAAKGNAYKRAPAELRAEILDAARAGDKPADIHRAIGYVQTYDYVARIIREDKAANPGLYPSAPARES